MLTISELQQKLRKNNVFETFGLNQIGVFGSFARGEAYHDIDFLIEQEIHFTQRELLKKKLTSILKIKIDLVNAKFADPIILYRAKKDIKYVTR